MSNKNKATGSSAAPNRREQLRLQQEAEAKRARTMRILGIAAAVLALVIVAVVATVVVNNNKTKSAAVGAAGTPPHANADKSGIIVNPGKAKDGAPVLQVYQDYQCPVCKQAEAQLGPLITPLAESGEIQVEYRTMNFMDTNLGNDSSTKAAIGAACADTAGIYKSYHDEIFANQPQQEVKGTDAYPDALLRETIPTKLGLSGQTLTDFQACYDTKATGDYIKGTNEKAAQAGVDATPKYRVNGKDLDMQSIGTTKESLLAAIKKAAA